MTRWEYARLESTERGIGVVFTHRQAWTGIAPEAFFQTLGRLGDEGWELVAALPLTATLPGAALSGTSTQATGEARDPRDLRDARPAGQGTPAPPAAATQSPSSATVQLTPDRWL